VTSPGRSPPRPRSRARTPLPRRPPLRAGPPPAVPAPDLRRARHRRTEAVAAPPKLDRPPFLRGDIPGRRWPDPRPHREAGEHLVVPGRPRRRHAAPSIAASLAAHLTDPASAAREAIHGGTIGARCWPVRGKSGRGSSRRWPFDGDGLTVKRRRLRPRRCPALVCRRPGRRPGPLGRTVAPGQRRRSALGPARPTPGHTPLEDAQDGSSVTLPGATGTVTFPWARLAPIALRGCACAAPSLAFWRGHER
jgi:hypothetical protein